MNKQMIFLFPLITIFIARSVPAALVIYWIITTIFSIGQQYYVNTNIRNEKLKTKNENSAELSPVQIDEPKENKAEKPAKKDLMTKVMQGRLDKQDKKKGVSITIREKK
jgi:membrane protein insertase Oxa1/YidC/SpoIIIJ